MQHYFFFANREEIFLTN